MTRAAIYARYSSNNQREASIDDQIESCRRLIDDKGWTRIGTHSDKAISGATTLRPGYQKLLEDASAGKFDIVVAEALDRLSRDQEDVAALYKRLSFYGIRLITLAEGEITELHVGLKGTMNALYLKDLAQKTRRGLEGRVRQGLSGGGNAYGYDVVRKIDSDGNRIRGHRRINEAHARIVLRIFEEFADGRSPRATAFDLNREGIPGPAGRAWGPSTIYGNWHRGTGILNNELYIGRLVWNRQRFIKDPSTGKRQARMNPEGNWIIEDVPHLRIIGNDLWDRVKERQQTTRKTIVKTPRNIRSEQARRPRYLLSGLLKCGNCGGGYSKVSKHHYGCSTARNKGTCGNRLTIRRDLLEAKVLEGLRHYLMHPDLVKEFIAEFHREVNRLAASRDHERRQHGQKLDRIKREIRKIIDAIKAGMFHASMKEEMDGLEARKADLERELANAPEPMPRLHPTLADVYRRKVANLHQALNQEETRTKAAGAIRALIEEIRLVPKDGELKIELYGELAALINLANEHPRCDARGVQVTLVAGAGFEPAAFRL